MKNFLAHLLGQQADAADKAESTERNLQVATAALLLEMGEADAEFTDDERAVIVRLLKERFDISGAEVEDLLRAANRELDKRVDIYYFTKQINEHFSKEQKIQIIEMVWRVIYTDHHLSGHEDYLVHRFANLLRLEHSQLIEAKLRVKGEM